jgi:hypothetical protein
MHQMEFSNEGLVRLVMTDRIIPQMDKRVGRGMVPLCLPPKKLAGDLRPVVGATEAHQGQLQPAAEETQTKAIMAPKADRRQ